jgi:GT2 family glycosyltransferase
MPDSEPLSVVIASKNRPADIARALASIARQTAPPADVIVIDQSEKRYDLRDFPFVRHLYEPSISGLTVARNRSIDELRTPRVLFVDDDVELPPGALAALAAAFDAHPEAIGFQCEDLEQHDYGRLTALLDTIFERGFFKRTRTRRGDAIEVSWLGGFGMAYRSSVFAHERFDDTLVGYSYGEDWDFSVRASRYGKLYVAPGADIHHYHSSVNRTGARAVCRMRWVNYHYFYRKHNAGRTPLRRLALFWWRFGEAYRWLRAGLGLPSNRKALQHP